MKHLHEDLSVCVCACALCHTKANTEIYLEQNNFSLCCR